MHTVWVRLNAVVFFSLSVLLVLALLAAFSSIPVFLGDNGNAEAPLEAIVNKVQMNSLRSLRSHGGVDRALFSIDIDADFRPAFHWNVKQLFVFVVAEYTSKANKLNQVVLWDKIIQATSPNKQVYEKDAVIKYSLIDQGAGLRGANVTLKVYYDTMPITSRMYMNIGKEVGNFVLPDSYFARKKGR